MAHDDDDLDLGDAAIWPSVAEIKATEARLSSATVVWSEATAKARARLKAERAMRHGPGYLLGLDGD